MTLKDGIFSRQMRTQGAYLDKVGNELAGGNLRRNGRILFEFAMFLRAKGSNSANFGTEKVKFKYVLIIPQTHRLG